MKPLTESEINLGRVVLEGTGCWSRMVTAKQVRNASDATQKAYAAMSELGPKRVAYIFRAVRKRAGISGFKSPPAAVNNGTGPALNFCPHCAQSIKGYKNWIHCGFCGHRLM